MQEPYIDTLVRDEVGKVLGLKNFGEVKKYQDQIKRLIDWATERGAKERADIIWAIEKLANRVGSPKLGNNWAQHLAQYAYLEQERTKIDNQLEEMSPKPQKVEVTKEEHGRSEADTT